MSASGNIRKAPSTRDDWETPPYLVSAIESALNISFSLDAAANSLNTKAPAFFSGPCVKPQLCECGLCSPWYGTVWLNPPYGPGMDRWVSKITEERTRDLVDVIVSLLPANTDAKWFVRMAEISNQLLFITGRISFLDPETGLPKSGNTTGSAVFVTVPAHIFPNPELYTYFISRDALMEY